MFCLSDSENVSALLNWLDYAANLNNKKRQREKDQYVATEKIKIVPQISCQLATEEMISTVTFRDRNCHLSRP